MKMVRHYFRKLLATALSVAVCGSLYAESRVFDETITLLPYSDREFSETLAPVVSKDLARLPPGERLIAEANADKLKKGRVFKGKATVAFDRDCFFAQSPIKAIEGEQSQQVYCSGGLAFWRTGPLAWFAQADSLSGSASPACQFALTGRFPAWFSGFLKVERGEKRVFERSLSMGVVERTTVSLGPAPDGFANGIVVGLVDPSGKITITDRFVIEHVGAEPSLIDHRVYSRGRYQSQEVFQLARHTNEGPPTLGSLLAPGIHVADFRLSPGAPMMGMKTARIVDYPWDGHVKSLDELRALEAKSLGGRGGNPIWLAAIVGLAVAALYVVFSTTQKAKRSNKFKPEELSA